MKLVRRSLYLIVFAMVAFGFPALSTTPPFTQCPAVGSDTSCALLVVINPGGGLSVYGDATQGPFDGGDDTLVGVYNNSSSSVGSINLTSSALTPFSFDGDGICVYAPFTGSGYCATLPASATGYEGPKNTFTNISTDLQSGTVAFTGGLAPGTSTYFSLDNVIAAASLSGSSGGGAGSPAPASIILVITGLAGAILYHTLRNSKPSTAV
jgi:hypothetical protein